MNADRWIVADLGGTNTRVGVYADGSMLPGVVRFATPPGDRERHLDLVAEAVDRLRHEQSGEAGGEVGDTVGVAVGATVDAAGRVRNATMLWHAPNTGFDLLAALRERLPWARIAVSNDIAAAAWRYRTLGRFGLVTISTGLAVKVFDDSLPLEAKLIQDPDGLGGEVGHVPVRTHTVLDAEIRHLARAAASGDPAAGRELAARDIAWCECGNADDLCSHASGPAAARAVARLAAALPELWATSVLHQPGDGDPAAVTTSHIAAAAGEGDPFTVHVLLAVTRPLALYVLQLSAQLGLRRFVVMGGFAQGVGAPWFAALRANLGLLLPRGAWFTGWTAQDVDALVVPSFDGDDSLIGMGTLVEARQGWVRELHKPVGRHTVTVRRQELPECGREQFLARIAFAGICSTDLQILRGDRGCEPGVLGHECVAEVVDVGSDVGAVAPGAVLAVNPNHPFDDHDKLGHNLPGVLREVAVWDGALADRGQTIALPARGAAEWVLLEPLACATRSLRQARDSWQGRTVVVVGSGVAGLLHVLLARYLGAARTLLVHRGTERSALAQARGLISADDCLALGPDTAAAVREATGGSGADALVMATSGTAGPQILASLWDAVADDASVHLFGGFAPEAAIRTPDGSPLPNRPIRTGSRRPTVALPRGGSCTLVGSRGAGAQDFDLARQVCVPEYGGTLDLAPLVSHVVSLDAAPRVFDELAATGRVGREAALRVVVDLREPGDLVRRVNGDLPSLAAASADRPRPLGARS